MSRLRTAPVLAAAALLIPAAAASAAPGPVTLLELPAFANGPQVAVGWDPAAFTPGSAGRQYRVTVQDMTVPSLASIVVPAPATGTVLSLLDGHEYSVRVVAEERECVAPGICDTAHINGPPSETRVTRVDSAPPVVAVQINGGAPFTNDPRVSLDVSAYDPAVTGRPASGVRTLAVSQAGAFSCSAPAGLDCLLPFAPRVPITLAPGPDGPRTVAVSALDAATTAGSAPPSPDGNASAPVSATRAARPPRPDAAGGPGGAERPPGRAARDRRAPQRRRHRRHRRQRPRRLRLLVELRRRLGGPRAAGRPRLRPPGHLQGDARPGRPRRQRRRGRVHGLRRRPHGHRGPRRRAPARARPAGGPARRAHRGLEWRPNPAASFYNVQLYRARLVHGAVRRRQVLSTFPRQAAQVVPGRLLSVGTYHLVVWSGLGRGPRQTYAPRPWIVMVLKVRPRPRAQPSGR